jgi:hypothetical protein
MAVKQKRIRCARCGERETVTKGERGPASIYCDLCRDEVKREQAAQRAQAYRQRKASYGGVVRLTHPPWPGHRFRRDTERGCRMAARLLLSTLGRVLLWGFDYHWTRIVR